MIAGWDECFDLVVIGSGAASVCACLAAQSAGKTAIIIEKSDWFGGSTAMSGGVIWIPNSPPMQRAGVVDSPSQAMAYLNACAGAPAPGSTMARREAYIREAPAAISFLEQRGMLFVYADGYADYHEGEYPGAVARGRSIVAQIYDTRRLKAWRNKLRRTTSPPILMHEAAALGVNGRTTKSILTMARVALRMVKNKLGWDLVGTGTAVQGRLLEIALRRKVPIRLGSRLIDLVQEGGKVTGVLVKTEAGVESRIRALGGVVLDSGGFAHNAEMRRKYNHNPGATGWTFSNPGDTGEVLSMAMALGADTAAMDLAWWNTVSVAPTGGLLGHALDMAKPHTIVVDQSGQRYVNEATSYVTVGETQYKRHCTVPAIPSWIILDRRHRHRYYYSGLRPGAPPKSWLESGYMIEAATIEALAEKCGIPPAALRATVDRFNGFARKGHDDDFGRGGSAYNRFFGDPANKPNPSLGTLEVAPFYAVRVMPGDVGTAGGLVADEYARVLRPDGSVIAGLYATGNVTAPVVGRSYPGAGASIGASMVFGYIAATHATGVNAS